MNKDNARLYLPLVQALSEGKVIQISHDGKWLDCDGEVGFSSGREYRIKPEPREWWLETNSYGHVVGVFSDAPRTANKETFVHVREVQQP